MVNNQKLFREIRVGLRDQYSELPSPDSASFISKSAIDTVLTLVALNNIFQPYRWHSEDVVQEIYHHMRRVVAVLILIEWNGWKDFEEHFLKGKDSSQRPVLGDHALPFTTMDIYSFIGDSKLQKQFQKIQYEVCPILITENKHETYEDIFRLPFIKGELRKPGMHGSVKAVKIERGQLKYTTELHEGTVNSEPKWMALKVLTADQRGTQSFEREKNNTELFKKALNDCKNVMPTFATFVHGDKLNIISPLADLDLFDFLEGKYPEFGRRAEQFSPQNLLKQMHDLASALYFLHEELYLDRQASCAHMDLKPENILINWKDNDSNFPVGHWRISDFGLSVIRDKPTEGNKGLATTGDMIRESSSMPPPRDAGPFQPPEMQKDPGRKSTVSKSSDLWSFGATFAMVLPFAIGGPDKTRELVRCRSETYDNDSFWTEDGETKENGRSLRQVLKPEINLWFNEQIHDPQLASCIDKWIGPCIQLIRKLLITPKRDRLSASKTRDELSAISREADTSPLWSVEAPAMAVPSLARTETSRVPTSQDDVGAPVAVELSSSLSEKSHGIDINNTSQRAVQSLNYPRRAVPRSDTRQPPLPIRERENSFQVDQTLKKPSSIALPALERCFRSSLSAESHAVAFVSPSKVVVYSLENMLKNKMIWSEKKARLYKNASDRVCSFIAREERQWTSALIAGDYLALVSKSKGPSQQMYAEVYQNIFDRVSVEHEAPRRIDLPDEYQEIRLSSKGAILLMFADYLKIKTLSRPYDLPSLGPGARFNDATFTSDGNWLCGWYSQNNREQWVIYDTAEWNVRTSQFRKIPAPPSNGNPLRPVLIPFHSHPVFAACDPYGRVCLIRNQGPKAPESLDQEQGGSIAGIVTLADDTLILIREMSAGLYPRLHILPVQNEARSSSSQSRYYGGMTRDWSSDACGIAVTEIDSSVHLLASFCDGIIMKARIGE